MLYPLEKVKAVTSAFGQGDAECSILHLLLSGSPCIGSRRTSLPSYHRRLTSINYCLYDTAPVAFVQLFSTLPRWLRHLKSGWRQGTSYKCFSPSNIYTVPTVSHSLNTTALTWPLQSFKFQKATDGKVHHTLRRLNFDIIQCLSLHFRKQYIFEEFKHTKIEQTRTSRSISELQGVADTAGSLGDHHASRSDKSTLSSHLNPRLFSSEGAAAAAHLTPPPVEFILKQPHSMTATLNYLHATF